MVSDLPGVALTVPQLRTHLVRDAPALGALLREVDPAFVVPGCGWTVGELAAHVGGIHRWVTAILRTGEVADEPTADGDPVDWYAAGWPPLLDALDAVDPDTACWNFGPRPRTARFWHRRMAHETALHLLDVRAAAGLAPTMPIDLAVDGMAEVTEVFVPRQVRLDRCPPLPTAALLVAPEGRWRLGDREPTTTVTGSALDLLLLVWRREVAPGLRVEGAPLGPLLALPIVP